MQSKVTPPERPRDASGTAYSGGPTHINSNAGTQVATGPCYLGCVVINNPGSAWVIDLYDGTSTSGKHIASISASAAGGNFVYDCRLDSGLFVNTTGTTAGSATVVCGSV